LHVPLLWVGVDVFFILSGFLITGILLNQKHGTHKSFFREFYARRARRILPAYSIAIALAMLLRCQVDWHVVWPWLVTFCANIPAAFCPRSMGVLIPMWSLAVEEHFYLFWPLLVYSLDRKTLSRLLIAFIVVAPVLRGVASPLAVRHDIIFDLTPFRVDLLAAGALLALAWESARIRVLAWHTRAQWATPIAVGIFAGLALICPVFRAKANSLLFNTVGYTMSVAAFTATVVYVLTLSNGLIYAVLTNKLIVRLGTVSYMAYLVHEPIIGVVSRYSSSMVPITAFIATVAFSLTSWKLIEAPLLKRR